jgi:hypothetical protein
MMFPYKRLNLFGDFPWPCLIPRGHGVHNFNVLLLMMKTDMLKYQLLDIHTPVLFELESLITGETHIKTLFTATILLRSS